VRCVSVQKSRATRQPASRRPLTVIAALRDHAGTTQRFDVPQSRAGGPGIEDVPTGRLGCVVTEKRTKPKIRMDAVGGAGGSGSLVRDEAKVEAGGRGGVKLKGVELCGREGSWYTNSS